MVEAIIGLVGAIILGIMGFVIHRKNDKLDELERKTDVLDKQVEIDRLFEKKLKEQKDAHTVEVDSLPVDTLIERFNAGDGLQDNE